MATRVRKAFRKNLFGIVTMVISAAVLLGFLFSSEGLQSLNQCSCTVEKHKTWIASPATIPKSGERNRKIHSCMLYLISI